jgi:DNA-directed RNA polymerase subunit beta'
LLAEKIYGRCLSRDIVNEKKKVILVRNTLLFRKEIQIIQINKITAAEVRSPLYCELEFGICQFCYGSDLSRPGEAIALHTAVGTIAAQSLSEPGTQLTMRTFHTGGIAADEDDIIQGLDKVKQILDNIKIKDKEKVILAKSTGEIVSVEEKLIKQNSEEGEIIYPLSPEKLIKVKSGDKVTKGEKLTTGKVSLEEYLVIMGRESCQDYIKKEIRKVYSGQGIDINEKHMEIFARLMLSKVEVIASGGSDYLVGDIVDY